jgi:predicted ATP-dependent serine protease
MARKELLGVRQPMSDEARAKIAASVRANAEKKRQELGIPGFSEKEPELVKMRNQNFDPDLFVNMTTGKEIDEFFSNDGGIPKACNYIITGGPGVGKSTVGLDILSDLAMSGHSVLFVSAEMTRIDLFQYQIVLIIQRLCDCLIDIKDLEINQVLNHVLKERVKQKVV